MINRRTVRKLVLQGLYAFGVSGDSHKHVLDTIIYPKIDNDRDAKKFAERLFLKTANQRDELDEIIRRHINNWKLERLATLDKLILRMALCEFLNFEEIPTKVTINEAIELAKDFSTRKSGKFVNGILDAALEELNEAGRINKKGRGLIDTSVSQ